MRRDHFWMLFQNPSLDIIFILTPESTLPRTQFMNNASQRPNQAFFANFTPQNLLWTYVQFRPRFFIISGQNLPIILRIVNFHITSVIKQQFRWCYHSQVGITETGKNLSEKVPYLHFNKVTVTHLYILF